MTDPSKQQTSSQMEAVMRLMTGKEERTIAQKLADPNRPTWEQYKKDNQDKLDIVGAEEKKMQAYRKELDEEREQRLARGTNHGAFSKKKKRKKRSDSDSDEERQSKKKRKKHKKRKHRRHYSSSTESGDSSDSDSEDSRAAARKRKHKRKKKKSKRKSDKKEEEEEAQDERYRLSNFFTQGSDED